MEKMIFVDLLVFLIDLYDEFGYLIWCVYQIVVVMFYEKLGWDVMFVQYVVLWMLYENLGFDQVMFVQWVVFDMLIMVDFVVWFEVKGLIVCEVLLWCQWCLLLMLVGVELFIYLILLVMELWVGLFDGMGDDDLQELMCLLCKFVYLNNEQSCVLLWVSEDLQWLCIGVLFDCREVVVGQWVCCLLVLFV